MGPNSILKLENNDPLPEIHPDLNAIFDFGAYYDSRQVEVLKNVDCVLVPVNCNREEDVESAVDFLQEIEEFTKKIIIIANFVRPKGSGEFRKAVGQYYSYPIFDLKQSEMIPKITILKASLKDMITMPGLNGRHHAKIPAKQFDLCHWALVPLNR